MKKLFTILFLFISLTVSAHRYYVSSSSGDDGHTGLTPALAWATIYKVNGFTFAAGDTISFNRGDLWREKLTVPRSGTAGNYMTFNAYGTGDRPKIYGSNVSAWTAEGHTNIWKSTATFLNPYGGLGISEYCEIFFEELDGIVDWRSGQKTYTADFANLTAEYAWTWNASTVYIYSADDPNTAYNSIEIPQRSNCIYVGNYDYVKLDSIEIRYAPVGVDSYQQTSGQNRIGFTLSYCKISWIGSRFRTTPGDSQPGNGYGTAVMRSDQIFRGNDIGHCGRRNTSHHLYSASNLTLTNMLYENNYMHHGSHGTGFEPRFNGNPNKIDGLIIRNNIFYEDPSWTPGVYIANIITLEASVSGSEIKNVQIYNNLFMHETYWTIDLVGNIVNLDIYNNTFYEHNKHSGTSTNLIFIAFYGMNGLTPSNVNVVNNIFYCTGLKSVSTYQYAILFAGGAHHESIATMDYNLFYYSDVTLTVIGFDTSPTANYRTSGGAKNMIPDLYNDFGWQEHSPTNYLLSPQFVSNVDVANLNLQVTSPAIGTATTPLTTTDYAGNLWASPSAVGAYEYNASPPVLVTSISISAAGSATTITVEGGTLQLYTNVEPDNATDTTKTWSIINGTGEATITQAGVVTAISDGTVTAKALANDASGVYDEYIITISNQNPPPGEGLPTVITAGVTSGWTAIWAIANGEVTDDGGGTVTDRGIVWGTSANPTTSGLHAHCGTGEGSFSYTITGLKGLTHYHYRAFATNGEGTAYSSDVEFITPRFSVATSGGKRITNGLGKFVMISR